jgi:radical SAM protein with 4Fe4S-binding SPASM domain
MPTNEKDLTENLIPFLETIKGNVKPLVGSMLQEGRAKFCENYSITELRSIIKNLHSRFLKNGWDIIRTPTKGIKRDGCLYRTIVINSNGDIYPCPIIKKEFLFSNIRNETDIIGFFQRWKESFEKSKVENMSQCSKCDLEYICGGGCRLKNYEVNKSILLPACSETDRINFYLSLIENEIA